jgi:hypothetical protein
MAKVVNKNKAFVRYDKNGYLVAGSLTINQSIPKNGDWEEIPSSTDCCNQVPLETFVLRLIFDNPANAPVANPNSAADWNTLFGGSRVLRVLINPDGEIQLTILPGLSILGFQNNTHIIKVIDEGGVSEIFQFAFQNCSNLEYVDFPNTSPSTVGSYAFDNCTSLEYVNVPKMQSVNTYSFRNCPNLTYINIIETTEPVNGSIADYGFSGSNIPANFPFSKLNFIGPYAFQNATGIGDVVISKGLNTYSGAFAGSSITSLTISPTSTFFNVGDGLFKNCTQLTTYSINSKSITSGIINTEQFSGCINLSVLNLPYTGITNIYGFAFYNCSSLTSLYFPSVGSIIGTYSFAGCTNVTSIYLPRATALGDSAGNNNIFNGITGKTISAVFNNSALTANAGPTPDGDIAYLLANNTVTYINSQYSLILGFDSVASIASLVPTYNNVSSWNTFFDLPTNGGVFSAVSVCDPGSSFPQNLATVNLLKTADINIKANLFENLSSLRLFDEIFPSSGVVTAAVKVIGNSSFKNSGIVNISVLYATSIGDYAFQGCDDLNLLYWQNSGGLFISLTSIGQYAFEGAGINNTTSTLFINYYASSFNASLTLGQYCFANSKLFSVFTNGTVLSVPQYAFQNCTTIISIDFSFATNIGDGAFAGCTGLTYLNIRYCEFLGSTTGNNGVFTGIIGKTISLLIQQELFTVNGGLPDGDLVYLQANNTLNITYTTVYPSGLRLLFNSSANALAFFGGTIDVASVNTKFNTVGNSVPFSSVTTFKTGKLVICYGGGGTTIPNSIFSGNTNIIEVEDGPEQGPYENVVSFSIVNIGSDAFNGCTNLTTAKFTIATNYGARAFKNCTALTTISLRHAYTFGDNCFENCTSLTSLNYVRDLVSVGNYAFAGCTNVTSYDFPALATIGDYAFYNNTSVTNINIPYCTNLGTTTGDNNVFTGISGNTITLTIPSALDTDADVVALQSANTVTLDRPSFQLTFATKADADTLVGGSTTVSNWNTFFSLPTNGTPFTSVVVTENVPIIRPGYGGTQQFGCEVKLYGGGNMTIPANRFSSYQKLRKVIDNGNTVIRLNNGAFRQATLTWYTAGGSVGLTPIEISLPACTFMEALAIYCSFGGYFVNLPRMTFFSSNSILFGALNFNSGYGPTISQYESSPKTLSFPNVISLASVSMFGGNSFSSINLPQQTFIPNTTFYASFGHCNIPAVTSTGNIIWQSANTFGGGGRWFVNMPLVTVLGTTVGNNSQWGNSFGSPNLPSAGSYRINPFLMTNNAGGPDGISNDCW